MEIQLQRLSPSHATGTFVHTVFHRNSVEREDKVFCITINFMFVAVAFLWEWKILFLSRRWERNSMESIFHMCTQTCLRGEKIKENFIFFLLSFPWWLALRPLIWHCMISRIGFRFFMIQFINFSKMVFQCPNLQSLRQCYLTLKILSSHD